MTTEPHEMTSEAPDVREGFYGFVASAPRLTYSDGGTPRLYFKAGQEHYQYDNGTRTKLTTTFHDVVAFNGAAQWGADKLAKQDWFLAHGRTSPNVNPNTGVEEQQFIASRLGHDLARTTYDVDRSQRRSAGRETVERGQDRAAGFEEPERDEPAHAAARTM